MIPTLLLLAACSCSSEGASVEKNDQIDYPSLPAIDAETDCADNDTFFARIQAEGYERAVYGFSYDNNDDIAVWRLMTRQNDEQANLILTISNETAGCRLVEMYEMSGPPG